MVWPCGALSRISHSGASLKKLRPLLPPDPVSAQSARLADGPEFAVSEDMRVGRTCLSWFAFVGAMALASSSCAQSSPGVTAELAPILAAG